MRRGAEGARERADLGRKLEARNTLPRTKANPAPAGLLPWPGVPGLQFPPCFLLVHREVPLPLSIP